MLSTAIDVYAFVYDESVVHEGCATRTPTTTYTPVVYDATPTAT